MPPFGPRLYCFITFLYLTCTTAHTRFTVQYLRPQVAATSRTGAPRQPAGNIPPKVPVCSPINGALAPTPQQGCGLAGTPCILSSSFPASTGYAAAALQPDISPGCAMPTSA